MNTLALIPLLLLPSHIGQDQFGRYPFVGVDGSPAGGGTSWGIVRPDLETGGWGRVCEEAFGPAVFFALQQPGRILLGGIDGLSTTTDEGCSYRRLDNELAGAYVTAIWQDPDDESHLLIGTSTVSAENGLWESFDGGERFTALLSPRPGNFFSVTAANDAGRIAVAGNDGAGQNLLLLSVDGGRSFSDVSNVVSRHPLIHALLFDGVALIVGGINAASEGVVDRIDFDGAMATVRALGTVPRETTHAVRFADRLFVLSKNGARGELYVENGSALGFGLVQGGPSDCLFVRDRTLWGCGKQAGLNTSLFLRSDDGLAWQTAIAFRDVHYRICPVDTAGYAACGSFVETACTDGIDNEVDGYLDCDDDDCKVHPACLGEGEGEGEGDGGEGDGEDPASRGSPDDDAPPASCAHAPAATALLLLPFVLCRRPGRRPGNDAVSCRSLNRAASAA